MNNNENSLFGSSVRSYKDVPINYSNRPNLVKYLHNQQKGVVEQPNRQYQTPLLIRNKSYDAFNSKIFDRPSKDKNVTSHQQFYQSINNSTPHKYINEVSNLQNQITRLMANELSIKTEKQMLQKELKKLKEEINYLNQKCTNLQKKNQSLFQNQSRIAILQREYNKLLVQFQQYKNNCRIIHNNENTIKEQPSPQFDQIQTQYYRLKDRQSSKFSNNKFSARVSPKVTWKKTSVAYSPIYKLDTNRKYSGNHKLEDLSLIQSKIDRLKQYEVVQREPEYYQQANDNAKTVDLKDLQTNKDYQSNIRALQSQLKDLRLKNISLYKKAQQYQQQKMKFMQKINEQNYQRTKMMSDYKAKQNDMKKQIEKIKLELNEARIKIIQLSEQIHQKDQDIKLVNIQKNQIQQHIQQLKQLNLQQWKQKEENNKNIINQLKQTIQKSQQQLNLLKQRNNLMAKKQEQLQIQNKLHLHQLQEKQQIISNFQRSKEQEKLQKLVLLQDSILSKTQNKIYNQNKKQLQKEDNCKYIQTSAYLETVHQPNESKTQISPQNLKQIHQKLLSQHNIWGLQLNKLRNQNIFMNDNYVKLAKLYESEKIKNSQLIALNTQWRIIQAKIKKMKHIDSTVDHLWQIKQAQYQNINFVISKLNRLN